MPLEVNSLNPQFYQALRILHANSGNLVVFVEQLTVFHTVPYIWTRSAVIFYHPSPRPRSPS